MSGFLLKKIVAQFLFPLPICLFLCFAGLFLLWCTRKQRTGRFLVTLGLLLITALSYGVVTDALLRPLENKYPAYVKRDGPSARYVVVLGGGHRSDPAVPVSSQLSDETLKRLIEGIRIYRQNPGSKLIVSGGSWHDSSSEADVMAATARSIGVPQDDLVLESESKDTADEARILKPLLSTNRFVLVTSATHLPRSMILFEREGLKPEPAPAEHLAMGQNGEPNNYFPRGKNLSRADRAAYEYLGLAWVSLSKR